MRLYVWLWAACGLSTDVTEATLPPTTGPDTTDTSGVTAMTPGRGHVEPALPVTGDALVVVVDAAAQREDGSTVPLTWTWTVDGEETGFDGPSVEAGIVLRGENWTAEGVPLGGGPAVEASVSIGNVPPMVETVVLSPPNPTVLDTLACEATSFVDAEGEAVAVISRTFHTDAGDIVAPELLPGLAPRGTAVSCSVLAGDGFGGLGVGQSETVVVGNAPPEVTAVTLAPAAPLEREDVVCTYTFDDADGDVDQSSVTWRVDGAVVATGVTWKVTAAPGQVISCAVDPFDGLDHGVAVAADATVGDAAENILLVIIDDIGIDKVGAYDAHPVRPPTPVLDELAASGRPFRWAYTNPSCSATRAAILTGRWGFQTGVGTALACKADDALLESEETLPEYLADAGYWTELIGKWHVDSRDFDFFNSPTIHGFDRFDSTLHGLGNTCTQDGLYQSYYSWEHCVDGACSRVEDVYNLTATVDEVVARVAAMPEPWFLVVGLNSPHAPYDDPPADLWSGTVVGTPTRRIQDYNSMVEAMDTEIGRMFASVDGAKLDRTHVVILGDNGTPDDGTDIPWDADRAKNTAYEAGVHVPMIVVGPAVEGPGVWSEQQFVHAIDLYATIADLAGVPLAMDHPASAQSVSLVGMLADPEAPAPRSVVYAEDFSPPGFHLEWNKYLQGIRDDRYRLVRDYALGTEEMYDMSFGWIEAAPNLLDGNLTAGEQAAYDALMAALAVKPW